MKWFDEMYAMRLPNAAVGLIAKIRIGMKNNLKVRTMDVADILGRDWKEAAEVLYRRGILKHTEVDGVITFTTVASGDKHRAQTKRATRKYRRNRRADNLKVLSIVKGTQA